MQKFKYLYTLCVSNSPGFAGPVSFFASFFVKIITNVVYIALRILQNKNIDKSDHEVATDDQELALWWYFFNNHAYTVGHNDKFSVITLLLHFLRLPHFPYFMNVCYNKYATTLNGRSFPLCLPIFCKFECSDNVQSYFLLSNCVFWI